MTDKAEFERLLDVYGFRCERFGQDLSTHARAQVVSAFAALASAPVADERAAFSRAEISFPLTIPENRVYLAGPMTGYEDHNFPAFHAAAERLRGSGLEVVNPADHGLVSGLGWSDYMRWDLVKLAGCHAVYVLPGWEKSKGASLEISIARALGMPVFTVDGAPLASAPVAGEAQRESEALRQARHDSANAKTERERVLALAGWLDQQKFEPEMLSCAAATLRAMLSRDAAPQASAEDVHNAALEKAARLMEQTGKRIAASDIRALKQPQADKDGGQQRAGDVVRDALWTLTEHNALHFGEQHSTVIQGRAALSATQAEQGERDA